MGDKSGRKRKHIAYYITISCIITATIVACVPLGNRDAERKAHQQLEYNRDLLAGGYFDTIISKNMAVLKESETEPPADIALYALGEVYANQEFPDRDYVMAEYYFQTLKENFPESPLTVEAKMYISFFRIVAAKEKEAMALKNDSLQKEKLVSTKKKKIPATASSKIIENNNFTEAVIKNVQILDQAGNKKPADEALYNLGLIFAHGDNPDKDYNKSQIYFYLLIEQFPESEFVEEAQVMMSLFETIEKIKQIDVEIEQQKKKLTR
ncbi:MAG: tetratricopeptide repeat protein [Desulfobulbaceae bacterium]|nr:tetratricopeptide repeat protein [Desulfobulbaceae bacterium]